MEACLSKSMGHKETVCVNWDRRAVWNWSFVLGYVQKWNSLFFPCWDFPCCHFPDWETQILNFQNMGLYLIFHNLFLWSKVKIFFSSSCSWDHYISFHSITFYSCTAFTFYSHSISRKLEVWQILHRQASELQRIWIWQELHW